MTLPCPRHAALLRSCRLRFLLRHFARACTRTSNAVIDRLVQSAGPAATCTRPALCSLHGRHANTQAGVASLTPRTSSVYVVCVWRDRDRRGGDTVAEDALAYDVTVYFQSRARVVSEGKTGVVIYVCSAVVLPVVFS